MSISNLRLRVKRSSESLDLNCYIQTKNKMDSSESLFMPQSLSNTNILDRYISAGSWFSSWPARHCVYPALQGPEERPLTANFRGC